MAIFQRIGIGHRAIKGSTSPPSPAVTSQCLDIHWAHGWHFGGVLASGGLGPWGCVVIHMAESGIELMGMRSQ
jgi:hypothetical protein